VMGGDDPKRNQPMFPGQIEAGNIDLSNRPVIKNKDGTVSTEKSFSIGTDQGEVLIPQVVGGKMLSQEAAINHYKKTGEHLGVFQDIPSANAAAEAIHNRGNVIIPHTGDAKYWYVDPNAAGVAMPQELLHRMDPNKYSPDHEDQMEAFKRLQLIPQNAAMGF